MSLFLIVAKKLWPGNLTILIQKGALDILITDEAVISECWASSVATKFSERDFIDNSIIALSGTTIGRTDRLCEAIGDIINALQSVDTMGPPALIE